MVLPGLNNYQEGIVLLLPLHFMQALLSLPWAFWPNLARLTFCQGCLFLKDYYCSHHPYFGGTVSLNPYNLKAFSSPINVQATNAISYRQQKDKYVWQLLNIIAQLKLGGICLVEIVRKQKKGGGKKETLSRCCRYSSYYFNFTPYVFAMTARFDSMHSFLQFFVSCRPVIAGLLFKQ